VVEGARLESVYTSKAYRGFESHPLRQVKRQALERFTLDSSTWDDAVRYSLGLQGNTEDGRMFGFVVGTVNDGPRLNSFTVNAGFRVNF
jgi:hypothetical protein